MRIQTDEFRVGQRALFQMDFTVAGAPVTPTTVTFKVLRPDGVTVDTPGLSGSGASRSAAYDPTVPGWHIWRVTADGNGVHDADEGRIYVHPASIP